MVEVKKFLDQTTRMEDKMRTYDIYASEICVRMRMRSQLFRDAFSLCFYLAGTCAPFLGSVATRARIFGRRSQLERNPRHLEYQVAQHVPGRRRSGAALFVGRAFPCSRARVVRGVESERSGEHSRNVNFSLRWD